MKKLLVLLFMGIFLLTIISTIAPQAKNINFDKKNLSQNMDGPKLVMIPNEYNFGYVTVGTMSKWDFVLQNWGDETASFYLSADPSVFGVERGGLRSLEPGDDLRFIVTFLPNSEGSYNGEVCAHGYNCDDCCAPLTGIGQKSRSLNPLNSIFINIKSQLIFNLLARLGQTLYNK